MAFEEHRATRCPQCGTADADWLDPDTKRLLDEPRWMPELRHCYGCETLAEEEEYLSADGRKPKPGTRPVLVPWSASRPDEDG